MVASVPRSGAPIADGARRRGRPGPDGPAASDPGSANGHFDSARPTLVQRGRNVWRYRELLRNLIRRELKVKYKGSALGFVWTLVNPLLYLVVFSVVFQVILESGIPDYGLLLLSGLLVWTLFSSALGTATASIVANGALVTKVWFPREILPIAAIGAAVVNFFFQALVLVAALAVFRHEPAWRFLPLLVPALAVLLLLALALGLALSALNVRYRDVGHLLELGLLAWFWMSAIVYPFLQISDKLGDKSWAVLLNPVIPVIVTFQKALYNPAPESRVLPPEAGLDWYARNLAFVGIGSLVLLVVAARIFGRLEDDLAEEI